MASAFSHIAIPAVLYANFKNQAVNFKLLLMASICSVIPDADVIAFKFGISYQSQWGHRGFTHSIVFAVVLACICLLFYRRVNSRPWIVFWFCFISCVSHPLLDMMTNGGLGVALYWPFSEERVFFSFRPIQVSPIGVGRFFTENGFKVMASELMWVLMPSLLWVAIGAGLRRKYSK